MSTLMVMPHRPCVCPLCAAARDRRAAGIARRRARVLAAREVLMPVVGWASLAFLAGVVALALTGGW